MKKHLTKILSVFMVIALLFGSVGMFATDTEAYTYIANGIDVSAWQGVINWTSVKASGIDFAILRIMASGKDSYFEANYTNGKAAGVKLGVYCYSYANTVAGAQAEANKVLSWLGGRTLEYPIYYDIEDSKQSSLTNAQRTQLCIAFCDVIEAAGYRAGIYSGSYWFNSKLDRATLTAKYEIWEAMWPASGGVQVNKPIYDKSSTCGMWQYSSVGSVPGISGRVDMDVSYKDYASYMIANGYNGYGNGTGTGTGTVSGTQNGYYQVTSSVNFRTGPSTSYDVISTLSAGTQVAVVGFDSTGTWAKVSYGGHIGYISKNYLGYIRAFTYSMNYLTNNTNTMSPQSLRHGAVLTVPTPAADPSGKTFGGWQLLRYSDFIWYTGSTWDESQGEAKLYQPGEKITFNDEMFNPAAGDDLFYLCAVWQTEASNAIPTVTPSVTNPKGYGWQWPAGEAYGYIGNYGGNGQDIELSVDLCLLPSSDGKTSVAAFYTDGTTKSMTISPTTVTVGTKSVNYTWGELGLDNWHNVKFKIYYGTGYVFIDGVQIAHESGMTANEAYQLLFSLTGEMAIDNVIMMTSTGTTFFSFDFEDAAIAQQLMGEGLGYRSLLGSVETVTPTTVTPYRYVWQWDESVSYGYFGGYGQNSATDIEFCADLCLLPSDNESKALFYTDGTSKSMTITKDTVTVGSKSVSYDWGELSIDNWHDVKFKVYNGTGYLFIDGKLIASESGMTANTDYQLLFSHPGTMAVDNVIIMSSTGTTYFATDYENSGSVGQMGESYGKRVLLLPDTSDFDVVVSSATATIIGTGKLTLTATPSAGEGHTYVWSCSNSTIAKYMSVNGDTCTINITTDLGAEYYPDITCTVTSDGGVTASGIAKIDYIPAPIPAITAITPSSAAITGAGKVTYTVSATGDGLSYNWTSSNSALNAYLSGANSNTLTVNIPAELSSALSATITCTVTNSYGKSAVKTASFSYAPAPAPTINALTPSAADITDSGKVSFSVSTTGDRLIYNWICSDSTLLPYITGADTDTITVTIPDKLAGSITATFTCTVTNSYGKTATSGNAILVYTVSEDDSEIEAIVLGDANGDGQIRGADSLIAKQIAAGLLTPTPEQEKALDVNKDGKINFTDTNLISRYIAGIILEF